MNTEDIQNMVIEIINRHLDNHEIEHEACINSELIGTNAILDSMGLVNIIVDIESEFLDIDIEISLTSEKAFSRKISPFRNIKSLTTFINEQINEPEK